MNKFITVAALLAAGTAFVNAATLICDFNSSTLSESGSTFTFEQNGLTFTATTTSAGFLASGQTGALGDWTDTWNATSMATLNGVVSGADATEGWKDYIYSSTKAGNITFSISGLEAGSSCEFVLFTGTVFEGAGSWNSLTLSTGSAVSVQIATSGGADLSDYTLGAESIVVRAGTAFVVSATADDTGTVAFSLNSTNGSHSTSLNYIAFSGTPAIPEPSAFGLLAGVGALAFVAARRRRTK